MANYYISPSGNDSTGDGLTPATAWKTINKAIGTGAAITPSGSGDTLYIAPGVYREAFTLSYASSSTNPLTIQGDPTGAVFSVAPGVVDWRAWTDDHTVSATYTALTIADKPYVTIASIKIIGSNLYGAGCVNVSGVSNNLTFRDCIFISHVAGSPIQLQIPYSAGAWNATFDRCDFIFSAVRGLTFLTQANTTEYSINTVVRNCRFIGRGDAFVLSMSGGSGSAFATGVTVQNCTALLCGNAYRIYSSNSGTMTTPIGVYGCTAILCSTGIWAYSTSMVAEDYNIISATTPRTNVTAGAHSLADVCPALNFGDERLTGAAPRPYAEPSAVSPFLSVVSGGSPPTVDLYNQTRPATPAAGALEIDSFPTGSTYIFQHEG